MAAALASGVEAGLDHAAWQVQRLAGANGKPVLVWTDTAAEGVRRYTEEPGVSAWRRMGVWFLALLPVESQL
jgi:putative cardiolipin synthase